MSGSISGSYTGTEEAVMLEIRQICKSFGRQQVLKDVNMTVQDGECVGIAGANGAGKSTLLEIIAGGIRPDAGEIYLNGEPVSGAALAAGIGFVPQENPLFEELSVKDNLELWYEGKKDVIERDMEEGTLSVLGISSFYNKRVSRLSGGMKKRLSIACALAGEPELLVLDEPGAALDIEAKSAIIRYLKEYAGEGHSVVIASHEIPELKMCDRLYGIKNSGTITDDIDNYFTDYMDM